MEQIFFNDLKESDLVIFNHTITGIRLEHEPYPIGIVLYKGIARTGALCVRVQELHSYISCEKVRKEQYGIAYRYVTYEEPFYRLSSGDAGCVARTLIVYLQQMQKQNLAQLDVSRLNVNETTFSFVWQKPLPFSPASTVDILDACTLYQLFDAYSKRKT